MRVLFIEGLTKGWKLGREDGHMGKTAEKEEREREEAGFCPLLGVAP